MSASQSRSRPTRARASTEGTKPGRSAAGRNSARTNRRAVQLLWELMLTAEPIVVRATTPYESSQVVLSLVSLIAPLKYYGDFRPYFTIHDSDCPTYVSQTSRFPCAVLGVTNPYFDEACRLWPTTVRVINPKRRAPGVSPRTITGPSSSPRMWHSSVRNFGVVTNHRQMVENDKSFLKALLQVPGQDTTVLTSKIHSQFLALTHEFMIPLERFALYFS